MRPPRIAILVIFLAASLFILCRSLTSRGGATTYPTKSKSAKSVWGLMYYNAPLSLFPPNAAISLTDDNSTSFAARPAGFGPKLAAKGLSGELWVGTGFPEESLEGDGELGCSDVPGWDSGSVRAGLKNSFKTVDPGVPGAKRSDDLLDKDRRNAIAHSNPNSNLAVHDGTDGHVNGASASQRADIQTLSESSDISGKVVLLMRGGCPFLDKVMWAQRRGAIAVIVGDNEKGGPLISMYAHGEEVENVTIPSVFTARTTAHLLSSLTQPGSFVVESNDNGDSVLKVKSDAKAIKDGRKTQLVSSLHTRRSWFWRMLSWGQSSDSVHSETKGRLDWAIVEEWRDEKEELDLNDTGSTSEPEPEAEFGVRAAAGSADDNLPDNGPPRARASVPTEPKGSDKNSNADGPEPSRDDSYSKDNSLLSKFFGQHVHEDATVDSTDSKHGDDNDGSKPPGGPGPEPHKGLWVTITPTSSASPFFDTLLVLVISPLVTLTVVYSLLIIRARIRRRRWRAPKSVVEQLPVRTYHAVAASLSPSRNPSRSPSPTPPRPPSPRLPSPSTATPTTPLLQQIPSRHRPRSQTTTGVVGSGSAPIPAPRAASREGRRNEHEKGAGGFSAEWRKYMGRQVECVVCLEEYVDGVSKVMSLPCGHEFHVDCITPWLTTRRRTCPICKGDVVRSLAHGTSSGPRYEPYRDDSDDEPEAESSGSRARGGDDDIEHGLSTETREGRRFDIQQAWLGLFSSGRNSSPRPMSPSPNSSSDSSSV